MLVDIDASNGCLDHGQLESAFSAQTAAVVVSHLHAGLAPMQQIMAWAHEKKVLVLEDACQAHGAIVDGRLAGTWGDISTLSFGGSKLMTAGRGGAVLTRNAELAQRVTIYAEQGNNAYPLSELQAAVLLPQLMKLDERNLQRRQAARQIRAATAANKTLQWVGTQTNDDWRPSYYKVAWLLNNDCSRDEWLVRAAEFGLDLGSGFRGFSKRSNRRCRKIGELPNSVTMSERSLLLHHPYLLSDADAITAMCERLNKLN